MACGSRNRSSVAVIAGYGYIQRVCFSRGARFPTVVARYSRHFGVFRSLFGGSGLCAGSFNAAPCRLTSRSTRAPRRRPVHYQIEGLGDRIVVPAGALADPGFPAPTVSVYERRKHAWVSITSQIEHLGT